MSGMLLHAGATIVCAHGGIAHAAPGMGRVRLGGQPAMTIADHDTISGCRLRVRLRPHPCVAIHWVTAATRVKIAGEPAVLSTSAGIAFGARRRFQGRIKVVASQTRVKGQ